MVEYGSLLSSNGFQLGGFHGPVWVPVVVGLVGLVLVWQFLGSLLKPNNR